MRVFVTGASGFLGAELVRALISRGHACAGLVRGDEGAARLALIAPRAEILRGDLFQRESYASALTRFAPDAVIHCGWRGVFGAARNDVDQMENIAASAWLAEIALAAGARTLIGVGSQAEYGARAGAFDENDPAKPETLYGVAKLATYGAVSTLARAHGARCAWARIFSLYGPGNDGPWLVPSLIRSLLAGERVALTKCEQVWEFTHVRDAALGVIALLETSAASGVFNVASGAPIALRDAVLILRDLAAPKATLDFGAIPYRADQVMRLEAKIDRIRAVTGWSPRISLHDGFAETIAAHARQRKAA